MAIGYISPRPGMERATLGGRVQKPETRPRLLSRAARIKVALAWTALGALTLLAGFLGWGVWQVKAIAEKLPGVGNIADIRMARPTTIVSSDGVLLAVLETQFRRPVSLEDISPNLINATIATEDARFYDH